MIERTEQSDGTHGGFPVFDEVAGEQAVHDPVDRADHDQQDLVGQQPEKQSREQPVVRRVLFHDSAFPFREVPSANFPHMVPQKPLFFNSKSASARDADGKTAEKRGWTPTFLRCARHTVRSLPELENRRKTVYIESTQQPLQESGSSEQSVS
ncbi:MAG: hypothetical protein IKS31_08045 [Clostridia bacterium]|nr:hypothetical protein [Clostridia bacterium]